MLFEPLPKTSGQIQLMGGLLTMYPLEEIIRELSPQRLELLILEIAESRAPDDRVGIDVSSLIERIVAGRDLGASAARSQAYRRLIETIRENVALIDGMKYIKSSD